MNEQEAIHLLKQNDPAGLEYLVKQNQVKAIRAAYLVVRERGKAEDIVQSAFIRVYERIQQFDERRPFTPWFMRIVINEAVKSVSRGIQPLSLNADPKETDTPYLELLQDTGPSVESQLEKKELSEKMWSLLEQLSPKQRAVVVLRYYLDFSESEIAEYIQRPKGTVKWRLHAARKRLRTLFKLGV